MANCQTCGQSMTVSEKTARRDGAIGNWHSDCADLEVLLNHPSTVIDPFFKATVAIQRNKLISKKSGQSVDYP